VRVGSAKHIAKSKGVHREVELANFEYIESWYNRKRLHGSIGYITPQKCEDLARRSA
jgi:hypothetical protein